MLTAVQIHALKTDRQQGMAEVHGAASLLQEVYSGKHEVTLPGLDTHERAQSANLIQVGLDAHAQRIASTEPGLICPPTKPTKSAIKRANQRRLTYQAWWYLNKMPMVRRLRARHLIGFGMSPVLIRPGMDGYPIWEVRTPSESFPAPTAPLDMVPTDCIFAFKRTAKWLRARYPIMATFGSDLKDDTELEVLQFVSADQYALVVIGKGDNKYVPGSGPKSPPVLFLLNQENRAGRPCVIVPGRITLGGLMGQFDQLIGMYEGQSKLWALQMHAVAREVFGETWVHSTAQGGAPNIIQEADPYDGTVGIIEDGQIQQFRVQSSQGVNQGLDRMERDQRITGPVPAELGGESPSNIRTGRRGGQVFSSAVDFHIQEHQEILAASAEEENKVAVAIAKAYWGDTPKTFQVPFGRGQVTCIPNTTFDTDAHHVNYAYAGADTNGLVIEGGQRIGQQTLSKRSFMEIDPMVTDPDAEHDQIIKESLELAFLQSIQTQASQPDGPYQPADLARITELVYTQDMELYEAVAKVHQEAQAAQAQQGAPGAEQAQPGLGQAGAPGTPQAAIAGPNASQANLSDLLNSLRRPQMGKFGTGAALAPTGPQQVPA